LGLNSAHHWARQPDVVGAECYERLMTNRCRACRAGLEHCHGALIHHPYRRDECTEDECVTPDSAHELHIDCSAVGCVCDEVVLAHRVG
jgi:hypothetical protein